MSTLTSTSEATLREPAAEGTRELGVSHLRDRLAVLNQALDTARPEALDLAAERHAAIHEATRGCMSHLGGHRAPDKWRKSIAAVDRGLTLVDLAYLATHPAAEPRAAMCAVAALLLDVVGDRGPVKGTLAGQIADAGQAAAAVTAGLVRAQEDRVITEAERADLCRLLATLLRSADAARALLHGVRP